jgi:alpha/beta superfamily hydrolase
MNSEKIIISGPAGQIDALLEWPANVTSPKRVAVLCHPHPLYGGSYTNKVVHILASASLRLGMPVLRFNFRGVGASDGQFDSGIGEQQDLMACVDWMLQRYPGAQLHLAGFSFGAFVAYLAQSNFKTERLLLIAPPLKLFEFSPTKAVGVPWIVILGTEDEIVEVEAVKGWVESQANQPHFYLMQGASHFFHGRLNELREIVVKEWAVPD